MRVKLKVLKGKNDGREIKISGPVFLIGRGADCHLRPKSDAISRRHCELTLDDEGVYVRDLGSKNGTLVNDVRITEPQLLVSGDVLRVGKLKFEVIVDQAAPARTPAEDVAEVAERTVEDGGWASDVSDWLAADEEAERLQRLADPETRQFRLDDTHYGGAEEPADDADKEVAEADTDTEQQSKEDTDGFFVAKPKKKKPGKLPARRGPVTDSSTQAAADTLKRFFNNRS